MLKLWTALFATLSLASAAAGAGPSPLGSIASPGNKHNLSASGPGIAGVTKSAEETRICVFCHTPHHANNAGMQTPLWSRDLELKSYDLYASSTLRVTPQQPTGASRLCLSCHDGTIALGMTVNGVLGGLNAQMPIGPSNLGGGKAQPLANGHPISFTYPSGKSELAPSAAALPPEVKLPQGEVQCTSCHDPHNNRYQYFQVIDNRQPGSPLCVACHWKDGWQTSVHASLNLTYPAVPPLPSENVYGCEVCHRPHSAQQTEALLRGSDEKQTCLLTCHNGQLSAEQGGRKVDDQFMRPYNHHVGENPLVHKGNENDLDPQSARYHVECVDCHNPHRVNYRTASAPAAAGVIEGVKTQTLATGDFIVATTEYEICYKCHAESYNTFRSRAESLPQRQYGELNLRQRFSPGNQSYHPIVAAVGSSAINAAILKPSFFGPDGSSIPLDGSSRIYCHDCHDPHGANESHLLVASYLQDTLPATYLSSDYQLCFRCHDETRLLDGVSSRFPQHRTHVSNPDNTPSHRYRIPCSVCHDPHGVAGQPHLINFDTRPGFVNPMSPLPLYSPQRKSCTVSCHTAPGNTHSY